MSTVSVTESSTVTKEKLVKSAMSRVELTKSEANDIVNAVIETMGDAIVAGNRIEIRGFGVFEKTTRKPKKGYNFKTQEEVVIPAKSSVKFKTSKTLERRLNS